jgi:hypothetical protein
MSSFEAQPSAETALPLTQMQRVTNTFSAPSKTFADIKRGNRSWWFPFIISIVFSYVLFGAITLKVGWPQVAQNAIRMNPKAQERMEDATPEVRAQTLKITQYSIEIPFALIPVAIMIFGLIIALVLWGTINFGFGGKASFGSVLAVWFYASLPGIFKAILGTIVLYAGLAPESFNISNPSPTNIGAFISPQDTGPALYKLATAIDFTTIWYLVLMGIGLSVVANVKRSSGYIATFGWWAIVVLVSVGFTAAFS